MAKRLSTTQWPKEKVQHNGQQNKYNTMTKRKSTTQWPKEKVQHNGQKKKYKQRSTKNTHKTKDPATRTPLKTGDYLRCSGRVGSLCSTSGTYRVNLVTNPVINHE